VFGGLPVWLFGKRSNEKILERPPRENQKKKTKKKIKFKKKNI
jgi:hypothetical protein